MIRSLSSLVPDAGNLLALEVEELAGVLLTHLNSYEGVSENEIYQNGLVSQAALASYQAKASEYAGRQTEVVRALMEAWAWLVGEVFLVREPSQPAALFFVSRRGQRLKSRDDFDAYRKASLLPKGQLHPLIAAEVYPAYLRDDTTRPFSRPFERSR
jgi:hypothetical protein